VAAEKPKSVRLMQNSSENKANRVQQPEKPGYISRCMRASGNAHGKKERERERFLTARFKGATFSTVRGGSAGRAVHLQRKEIT